MIFIGVLIGKMEASDWSTLSNETTNFVLPESFLCYSNHQNNDRVIYVAMVYCDLFSMKIVSKVWKFIWYIHDT